MIETAHASPVDHGPVAADPLARGDRRAQQNLLRLQHEEGYWCGELVVDSTLCSDYVLYMHWADEVDPVLEEKCVAHIRRRQLRRWRLEHLRGRSERSQRERQSLLRAETGGHPPTHPWMQEARACILRLGGIPRMNTYAKLYLALLGQFPWKYLPTVPAEIDLLPEWCFFNVYELSSWSRAMLMPLAILNHFKPTRELPADKQIHELYPVGTRGRGFLGWHARRAFLDVARISSCAAIACSRCCTSCLEAVARTRPCSVPRHWMVRAHGRGERRARRDLPGDAERDDRAEGAAATRRSSRFT